MSELRLDDLFAKSSSGSYPNFYRPSEPNLYTTASGSELMYIMNMFNHCTDTLFLLGIPNDTYDVSCIIGSGVVVGGN